MTYVFQFGIVWDHWPRLLDGAWLTLRMSGAALAIGLVLSVLLAFGRRDGPRWVRLLIGGYVEVIRNTPFLVQLFILYFSLPGLGLRLDAAEAALIGMAMNFAGYGSEIVRSGIQSVSKGQWEAARALGLAPGRIMRLVILPQALRVIIPPLTSQFLNLTKNSSLAVVIGYPDLVSVANTSINQTGQAVEVILIFMAVYLALSLITSGLMNVYNRAVALKER